MNEKMEHGVLDQFGSRGFGFIKIPRPGCLPETFYCHVAGFRRPEAQVARVIFRTSQEIDPAGTLVGQLRELASSRVPVAFIPGRNDRGPLAEFWCVAATLATAELEVINYLTKEAKARQEELARLRPLVAELTRESEGLLRLTPESLEDALALGWTVREDQGRQVVMVTIGSDGRQVSRTFSKKVRVHRPSVLPFRQTG